MRYGLSMKRAESSAFSSRLSPFHLLVSLLSRLPSRRVIYPRLRTRAQTSSLVFGPACHRGESGFWVLFPLSKTYNQALASQARSTAPVPSRRPGLCHLTGTKPWPARRGKPPADLASPNLLQADHRASPRAGKSTSLCLRPPSTCTCRSAEEECPGYELWLFSACPRVRSGPGYRGL